jgi:hypothetical protein
VSLDVIREKIGEIEAAVKNGVDLKVTADTTAVDAAKERLKQPTQSTHIINVVENRNGSTQPATEVQAHATGGYVTGKGSGTSDEIPAMLSNGEYVIKADKVKQHGVQAFDAINYGNVSPNNHYATGGLVGGDVKAKAAELKKKKFEEVAAFFDQPFTQLSWTHSGLGQSLGSEDAARLNFQFNAEKYLRDNGLPLEFLADYMKNLKLSKDLTNAVGFDAKAKAQLAIDEATATPAPADLTPTVANESVSNTPAPVITSTPSPNIGITPAGFTPPMSRGNTSATQIGKVSTIKFEAPNGKTTIGQFSGNNPEDFFSQLDTISGVTRV